MWFYEGYGMITSTKSVSSGGDSSLVGVVIQFAVRFAVFFDVGQIVLAQEVDERVLFKPNTSRARSGTAV